MTLYPDTVFRLSVLLAPLTAKHPQEPEAPPSSSFFSHVIRPPLQFSSTFLFQQLLVGFVSLRECRNRGCVMVIRVLIVLWYVVLADSWREKGPGFFYSQHKHACNVEASVRCSPNKMFSSIHGKVFRYFLLLTDALLKCNSSVCSLELYTNWNVEKVFRFEIREVSAMGVIRNTKLLISLLP